MREWINNVAMGYEQQKRKEGCRMVNDKIKRSVENYASLLEYVKEAIPGLTRKEQFEIANHIYKVHTIIPMYRQNR